MFIFRRCEILFITASCITLVCSNADKHIDNGVDHKTAREVTSGLVKREVTGGLTYDQSRGLYLTDINPIHPKTAKLVDFVMPKRRRSLSALWKIGKAATAALLEGSKKVYPFAGKFYEKYGGYDEAVKDFYSVNPINVRSFRSQSGFVVKTGRVGDRNLFLHDSSPDSNPVLEIIPNRKTSRTNTTKVTKITYKEKQRKSRFRDTELLQE